ncbi:hypothetical protein PTSG_02346 [Salpingoeca rosetta]|uniref:DUF3668 domain-containing protein n=1 Tax=Salpingoeca rosetta (strain ATCC 50818 / BSB-021) TaxID=946362 RepID=F2U1X8_SALR5|nr:uncharacterized protein PTSG_02346 [Salpingoeca rosetta]EGD81630.1 hypothetical protein PTSG_02346 [Salpingoeca rosetta]|eukprot:XP_004996834.1 hypothetical protein PTSG_02346 [Salpingoeca rosetta]
MATSAAVAVVVAVLQGKGFPERKGLSFVVRGRFDSKVLLTDPVPHHSKFLVENELAWMVDHKTLHQLRVQRTPIKLECVAIDERTKVERPIGYIMLDLRSINAQETTKWFSLSNNQYPKAKPMLQVMFCIETQHDPTTGTQPKDRGPPLSLVDPGTVFIGASGAAPHPPRPSDLSYTAAVESASFEHLTAMLAARKMLTFNCVAVVHVLGMDIESDRFTAARAGHVAFTTSKPFTVRGSRSALARRFDSDTARVVVLNTATFKPVLATELSLAPCRTTIGQPSTHTILTGAARDGEHTCKITLALTFRASDHTAGPQQHQQHHQQHQHEHQQEEQTQDEERRHTQAQPRNAGEHAVAGGGGGDSVQSRHDASSARGMEQGAATAQMQSDQHHPHHHHHHHEGENRRQQGEEQAGQELPALHHDDYEDDFEDDEDNSDDNDEVTGRKGGREFRGAPTSQQHVNASARNGDTTNSSSSSDDGDGDGDPVYAQGQPRAVARQSPPPQRQQPHELQQQAQQQRYSHAAGEQALPERLAHHHHPQPQQAQEQQPQQLHQLPPQQHQQHWHQFERHHVASDQQHVHALPTHEHDFTDTETVVTAAYVPTAQERQQRQLSDTKAALDLEVWMQREKERFQASLEKQKRQVLETLAEEWRQRNEQREALIAEKIQGYQKLEGELKQTLADLSGREKELERNEEDLHRRQTKLEDDYQRKLMDLQDASRRLEQDFLHQTRLQAEKVKGLEEDLKHSKALAAQYQQEGFELRREIASLQTQLHQGPNARLEHERAVLQAQNTDLRQQLKSSQAAKEKYKAQWTKALQTIARLKQKSELVAREQLRREQSELEHMRLQYLAHEERQVASRERQELEELKEELRRLADLTAGNGSGGDKHTRVSPARQWKNDGARMPRGRGGGSDGDRKQTQAEVGRLAQERDALLASGVYQPHDAVIVNLDRQINRLLGAK